MTATVQRIIDSYDALPDNDRHQAAVEILRRFTGEAEGDLPENSLIQAAQELFLALDVEEASHAKN